MIDIGSSPKFKIIVLRDMKNPFQLEGTKLGIHITVGLCISADSEHLKLLVILPLKCFPEYVELFDRTCVWLEKADEIKRQVIED